MDLSRTVIVLAYLLCLASPARALVPTEIFAQVSPAVAMLDTFDEQGQRLGSYSATVIEPERLVTTCDVLETAATLRVVAKSASLDARVAARDRERNLCLISAPGLAIAAVPRLTQPLAVGSRVFALSNALGLGVGISEGIVSGIRSVPAGNYIQFSAPISPGSEGGALVDDGGRLVGVSASGADPVDAHQQCDRHHRSRAAAAGSASSGLGNYASGSSGVMFFNQAGSFAGSNKTSSGSFNTSRTRPAALAACARMRWPPSPAASMA